MTTKCLRNALLLFLFAIVFSSCSSIKIPKGESEDFARLFDGQSQVIPIYSFTSNSNNIGYLFNQKVNDSLNRGDNGGLRLKFVPINKKRLLVQLWNKQGDTLSNKIKGKYIGEAFKTKTKVFFNRSPFPLIWGIGTSDNIIAKNYSGELIVYHNHGGLGFFTLLPILGTNIGLDDIKLKAVE